MEKKDKKRKKAFLVNYLDQMIRKKKKKIN